MITCSVRWWGELTHLFSHFKVWNLGMDMWFHPHFIMDVITKPSGDSSKYVSVNVAVAIKSDMADGIWNLYHYSDGYNINGRLSLEYWLYKYHTIMSLIYRNDFLLLEVSNAIQVILIIYDYNSFLEKCVNTRTWPTYITSFSQLL